jgi:tRNA A37 threonylcarbamoyladenosine dehydratase
MENESNNTQCRLPERFYTKQDLNNMFSGRKIYIWGAGRDGKGVFHALKRNGWQIAAFIDMASTLFIMGGGGGGGDEDNCIWPTRIRNI